MKTNVFRQVALTLTLIALVSLTAFAQPGGGRGGRGGFGGGFGGPGGGRGGFGGFPGFGGTNDVQFAMRSDVQKELGLSDKQVEELGDVEQPSMRDIMQDEGIDFREMFRMSQDEREDVLAPVIKKVEKLNKDAAEEVFDILTSKQKRRFRELKFQYDVSRGRATQALAANDVDLSSRDEDDLQDALRDVNRKLQAKIAELRMELYIEALGSVVSESKVEDLMGKAFAFDQAAGGRGSFGGGRGGPGGGRGGDNARGGRRGGDRGDAGGDNPRRRQRPSGDHDDESSNPRRRRSN